MILAFPILALALAAPPGDGAVPAPGRALLLLRVLGYDRELERRCGDEVTVAVAWRAGEEEPRDELVDALREAAARFRVAGRRVRAVPLRLEPAEPGRRAREAEACVAVLAGPAPEDAAPLARELAGAGVLSVAAERSAVVQGFALAFLRSGERTRVVVNVAAARSAGAELDAALFTVAEAVGGAR